MGSAYLIAYNSVLAAGWAYVLYLTFAEVAKGGWTREVYEAVDFPLKIVQTTAIAEIFHSIFGIVKSPFFTTFIQVLSRLWALWGLVNLAPQACSTGAVSLLKVPALGIHLQLNLITLLFAWCCSETLRYSFYAFKELGIEPPKPLIWLRYSAFIVLYPVGVASEMTMAYLALPTIKRERPWSVRMPNAYNFGFDYYYACFLIIACYVPGLPELYMYMVKQRKKVLGGGDSSSSSSRGKKAKTR